MTKTIHDKQYWLNLTDRYFDAATTDDEEHALRRFAAQTDDPEFDELRAVMGFTAMGRRASSPQPRQSSRPLAFVGMAASVLLVLGLTLFYSLSHRQPDTVCTAWVRGEMISDPTQVMALMQSTMVEMNIGMEGIDPVEEQLRDMFKTMNQ